MIQWSNNIHDRDKSWPIFHGKHSKSVKTSPGQCIMAPYSSLLTAPHPAACVWRPSTVRLIGTLLQQTVPLAMWGGGVKKSPSCAFTQTSNIILHIVYIHTICICATFSLSLMNWLCSRTSSFHGHTQMSSILSAHFHSPARRCISA